MQRKRSLYDNKFSQSLTLFTLGVLIYSIYITKLYIQCRSALSCIEKSSPLNIPKVKQTNSSKVVPIYEIVAVRLPLSLSYGSVVKELSHLFRDQVSFVPYDASSTYQDSLFVISYASSRLDDDVRSTRINTFRKKYKWIRLLFITTEGCAKGIEYQAQAKAISIPNASIHIIVIDTEAEKVESCNLDYNISANHK